MIEERNGKKKRWQEKELIRPRSAETRCDKEVSK